MKVIDHLLLSLTTVYKHGRSVERAETIWRVLTLEDYVRIPVHKFGEPLERAAYEQLKEMYEGRVEPDVGVYVKILDLSVSKRGVIRFGDSATYHSVRFKVLVFTPMVNEVVEGDIVNTTDFGAFVRLGPINGFIHKTQLLSDNVIFYDKQSQTFIGEKSKRRVGKGDTVRARIVGVSYVMSGGSRSVRVALTARQMFLGKPDWIEEDIATLKRRAARAAQK